MLFCHHIVNNFFGNLQKTFCEGFLKPRCFMRRGKLLRSSLLPVNSFSSFSRKSSFRNLRRRAVFMRRTRCLRFQPQGVNASGLFFGKSSFHSTGKELFQKLFMTTAFICCPGAPAAALSFPSPAFSGDDNSSPWLRALYWCASGIPAGSGRVHRHPL